MKSDFAARLRAARKKAGLTQQQAAERLGVFQQVVQRWEAGRQTPPAAADVWTQEKILRMLQG